MPKKYSKIAPAGIHLGSLLASFARLWAPLRLNWSSVWLRQKHSRIIFGLFWECFGIMVGSFWDLCGIVLGLFLDKCCGCILKQVFLIKFRITFGSFQKRSRIIFGLFWEYFGIMFGSFWDHFGIVLGSFPGKCWNLPLLQSGLWPLASGRSIQGKL